MRALPALVVFLACAPGSNAAPAAPAATLPREPVSPRASSPSTLEAALALDMAKEDAMPWSASRRLVWRDFEGPPPSGGDEAARTGHALFYAWSCRGDRFAFRVTAAFLPRQSWVKSAVVADSIENPRVLRHEQLHFDLSELHARHMRRHFGALAAPCDHSDAQLESMAQRYVRDERAEQRRYDAETQNGLLDARQLTWQRDTARRLRAEGRYAQ